MGRGQGSDSGPYPTPRNFRGRTIFGTCFSRGGITCGCAIEPQRSQRAATYGSLLSFFRNVIDVSGVVFRNVIIELSQIIYIYEHNAEKYGRIMG